MLIKLGYLKHFQPLEFKPLPLATGDEYEYLLALKLGYLKHFQPLEFKPLPLATGDEYEYLLALKQEFRGTMKESAFYMKPQEKKKDIGRYSDKYQLGQHENNSTWEPGM